ncbi:MAG: hypothetical protein LBR92_01005 [Puniceicoccales bacterium]|jgi:hypothetical protein|nr:hypothetical protein [Puniceicoccales bacterium]
MLGSILIDSEIVEDSEIARLLARKNELIYYLITDATSSTLEQVVYPLKGVFVVSPDKRSSSAPDQRESETFPLFAIHARTPSGINNQILKLLPFMPEGKENAFLIDYHLSLSLDSRLALYRLLSEKHKHVYFLNPMGEEQNNFSDFTEIFPDEKIIMLFEQVAKFATREGRSDFMAI